MSSEPGVRRMTHMEAVIDAMSLEMRRDERVFLIGQDVGPFEGVMQSTRGMFTEFGPARVREAPISESAMVGIGVGAAMFGLRPIVDVSFGEFLPAAMNQLINQAPNVHYMTDGSACVPMVIRTRVGDGPYGGHPQDYSSWFAHVPGLKVVMPSNARDAKGLMIAAIRDDNPVLFIEPMSLSHSGKEEVPIGDHVVSIGSCRISRPGTQVTVVAVGSMVPVAMSAAAALALDGIDVEVIDPRSLRPWDADAIVESVRKTGCLVTVQESWASVSFSSEVVATVAERALDELMAPTVRVGAAAVPIPSGPLRKFALPNQGSIIGAVRKVMSATGRAGGADSGPPTPGLMVAQAAPKTEE